MPMPIPDEEYGEEMGTDSLVSIGGTNAEIESAEAALLGMPTEEFQPVECPLKHTFAPGIYRRQVTMPAGAFVIGHMHRFAHLNEITRGKALVSMNGVVTAMEAPFSFVSAPGVRKVLFIVEEMDFATFHPNPDDCQDIAVLESRYVEKSASYLKHQDDLRRLKELTSTLSSPCPTSR